MVELIKKWNWFKNKEKGVDLNTYMVNKRNEDDMGEGINKERI